MTKRSKVFSILRRVFEGKEERDSSYREKLRFVFSFSPHPFCRVPARNSTFDSWKFCLTSFQNRSSCSHPLLKSSPLLCKSEKERGLVRKFSFSSSSSSWFAIIRVPGLGFLRLNLSKEGAVFTIEEGSVERSRLVSPLANSSSQFRRRLAWNSGEAPSPDFSSIPAIPLPSLSLLVWPGTLLSSWEYFTRGEIYMYLANSWYFCRYINDMEK